MATPLQRQEAKLKAEADALARQLAALKQQQQRHAQAQKRHAAQVRQTTVQRLGTLAYDAGLGGLDDASLVEAFTRLARLIDEGGTLGLEREGPPRGNNHPSTTA